MNWSMVTCKMASPVAGTTLGTTGPMPQTLGSARHRYAMYVCMYVWSSHIAEYGSTG